MSKTLTFYKSENANVLEEFPIFGILSLLVHVVLPSDRQKRNEPTAFLAFGADDEK